MLSYPHDLTSSGKGDDGGLCLVSTSTIVFRLQLVIMEVVLFPSARALIRGDEGRGGGVPCCLQLHLF